MNTKTKTQLTLLGALTISVVIVYAQTRTFSYIELDDPKHLIDNPAFHPITFYSFLAFWKNLNFGMFIPMTYTVWGLVTAICGFDVSWFHFLNVGLHAINTLLVFALLQRWLPELTHRKNTYAAAVGALVFALHPVQVEAVAWISGLRDVLCLTFALLSLYLLPSKVATLTFLLALFSKPVAVILPLLVPGKKPRLWFALSLIFIVITKALQPDATVGTLVSVWARPLIALDALGFYLRKISIPYPMGIDYGRNPELVLNSGWLVLNLSLAIALLLATWIYRKKNPWLAAGVSLFVAGCLPVLGLIPFQFQKFSTVADRYLYFPMLGVALIVGGALSHFKDKTVAFVAVALLAVLGPATWRQVGYWENSISIFEHSLVVNPSSLLAHINLGYHLFQAHDYAGSADHFKQAVLLEPKAVELRISLGSALASQRKFHDAKVEFEVALKLSPGNRQALTYLGLVNREISEIR